MLSILSLEPSETLHEHCTSNNVDRVLGLSSIATCTSSNAQQPDSSGYRSFTTPTLLIHLPYTTLPTLPRAHLIFTQQYKPYPYTIQMEILALCLIAILPLLTIAAPNPASNAGRALDLGLGLAPQPDPAVANDLFSEVLGTAGRVASLNDHVKGLEEAQYESALRHLPIDDATAVEGGLERRVRPKAHAGKHAGWQKVLNVPNISTGNTRPTLELPGKGQVGGTADPDEEQSGLLLKALRAELIGRYQHTVFWKQSKLPHRFFKVADV